MTAQELAAASVGGTVTTMPASDRYNRFIYRLWAPGYDRFLRRSFHPGRVLAMSMLALAPGERVLVVGVGTGLDLPLLPPGVHAVGLDQSEPMMARARRRLPLPGREVELVHGDAHALPMPDASFDAVVLNLILSVLPDPRRCLAEALRVARPGGRLVVFDKFLADDQRPSLGRRLANLATRRLGTDLNRRLSDILRDQPCAIVREEPGALGGFYRVVLLARR